MQTSLCFVHILSGVTIYKIRKQICATAPNELHLQDDKLKIWLL